jgi:hypothetical protein
MKLKEKILELQTSLSFQEKERIEIYNTIKEMETTSPEFLVVEVLPNGAVVVPV